MFESLESSSVVKSAEAAYSSLHAEFMKTSIGQWAGQNKVAAIGIGLVGAAALGLGGYKFCRLVWGADRTTANAIVDVAERFLFSSGKKGMSIGLTEEEMRALEMEANKLEMETGRHSINVDGIDPAVGLRFDGHGISRGSDLIKLNRLLTQGIDPKRPFHTIALSGAESSGEYIGASNPYSTGGFIVLGHPDRMLRKRRIGSVLVNKYFYSAIPTLNERFPNVRFIRGEEAEHELAKLLVGKRPPRSFYELYAQATAARETRLSTWSNLPPPSLE